MKRELISIANNIFTAQSENDEFIFKSVIYTSIYDVDDDNCLFILVILLFNNTSIYIINYEKFYLVNIE